MAEKQHEAVRNTLALFRSTLETLAPEHREEVMAELGVGAAVRRTLEAALNNEKASWATERAMRVALQECEGSLAELKAHNEQRLEEVYAAREQLGAQPNETLPMAIKRVVGELMASIAYLNDQLQIATRT